MVMASYNSPTEHTREIRICGAFFYNRRRRGSALKMLAHLEAAGSGSGIDTKTFLFV